MSRYVASTGSDAASGTYDSPLQTVQRALDLSLPGDTVLIRGGQVAGFDVTVKGTAAAPITIRASGGEHPSVHGEAGSDNVIRIRSSARFVILDGLTIEGSIAHRGAGILVENNLLGPVVIRGCRVTSNAGFGINVYNSRNVSIHDNDISSNGTGIQVIGEGADVHIVGNEIHDNDRMIVNTPQSEHPQDDYGAVGVALVGTVGPTLVEYNHVWANRAKSYDYGWDGGAFELFAASGSMIRDNVAWNNQSVLETGTNGGSSCRDNVFQRNVAYGATSEGKSRGIILRCGSGTIIAFNTMVDLDDYALRIGYDSALYSGSIDGSRVTCNIFAMHHENTVYQLVDRRPSDLTIDHNLLWNDGAPLAEVAGAGTAFALAPFRQWTGYEHNGVAERPLFLDRANHDYQLSPASAAVDRGLVIPGISDQFQGAGPDLGAMELP